MTAKEMEKNMIDAINAEITLLNRIHPISADRRKAHEIWIQGMTEALCQATGKTYRATLKGVKEIHY